MAATRGPRPRPELRYLLRDPLIPLHDNASEAALRIVALARKNTLFFGNAAAARKLMVLYSLVATCVRHGKNPEAYLVDVLMCVQDTRFEHLHELLPHRWRERAECTRRSTHIEDAAIIDAGSNLDYDHQEGVLYRTDTARCLNFLRRWHVRREDISTLGFVCTCLKARRDGG